MQECNSAPITLHDIHPFNPKSTTSTRNVDGVDLETFAQTGKHSMPNKNLIPTATDNPTSMSARNYKRLTSMLDGIKYQYRRAAVVRSMEVTTKSTPTSQPHYTTNDNIYKSFEPISYHSEATENHDSNNTPKFSISKPTITDVKDVRSAYQHSDPIDTPLTDLHKLQSSTPTLITEDDANTDRLIGLLGTLLTDSDIINARTSHPTGQRMKRSPQNNHFVHDSESSTTDVPIGQFHGRPVPEKISSYDYDIAEKPFGHFETHKTEDSQNTASQETRTSPPDYQISYDVDSADSPFGHFETQLIDES
jgi:hypothetical protein